jgi:hypothetical protein
MSNKPKLERMTFLFTQESNCVDGGEWEMLQVECKSSLGMDYDDGAFFVLTTEKWSVNDSEEIKELLQRVQDGVDGALKGNTHKSK